MVDSTVLPTTPDRNEPNIRFILVESSHAGNIGGAARALKNMALSQLTLVRPQTRFPSAEATARASGADDLLMQARLCDRVEEAIADCTLVVGTSARPRGLYLPEQDPRSCAAEMLRAAEQGPVGVLFGRERSGLTNAELDHCQLLLRIPTSDRYSSLNLAAAVQVLAYELMLQRGESLLSRPIGAESRRYPPATAGEMAGLYDHIEESIIASGFLDPDNPGQVMRRLRRLFNRAAVDRNEVNILRGILSSMQRQRGE